DWSEYERLMIAEAFRRGESVYYVAMHLDPEAFLPAAAFELSRKALESAGRILALRPEMAPVAHVGLVEAALASAKSPDWIRQRCQGPSVGAGISVAKVPRPDSHSRDLLEILLDSEAAAVSAVVK